MILAKPENDGLHIGCIVGLHGSFVFDSLGADLIVRGILYSNEGKGLSYYISFTQHLDLLKIFSSILV